MGSFTRYGVLEGARCDSFCGVESNIVTLHERFHCRCCLPPINTSAAGWEQSARWYPPLYDIGYECHQAKSIE